MLLGVGGVRARGSHAWSYTRRLRLAKLLDTDSVRGLLGLFLADGRLEQVRAPVRPRISAIIEGGTGETDFLEEKVAELRRFLPTRAQIRQYQTSQRESGNRTTVLRFRVHGQKLRPIYNLLYPYGRRQITSPALELLGGRAAAWLWAEGAKPLESGGFMLRRVGYEEDEALLLSSWLRMLTGAESELCTLYQSPRLLYGADQAALLQTSLLPYAPLSRRQLFLPPLP